MKIIGIVGHAQEKFTKDTEMKARDVIVGIIEAHSPCIVVSGRCPMGGIDVWAEEIAYSLGQEFIPYEPKINVWQPTNNGYGFRARNLDIAKSDIVYNIVVEEYPVEYTGREFFDYHCHDKRSGKWIGDTPPHIKSGGCWTARKAIESGNKGVWKIIRKD